MSFVCVPEIARSTLSPRRFRNATLRGRLESAMVHTFEILYMLNRRESVYCAYKLNQRVNADEKRSSEAIRAFLRKIHIRRKYEGIQFKGLRIPGIHQIDLLKYKNAPGSFYLYITIEPEVLITGENTLEVYYCGFANMVELQTKYAQAI